MINLLGICISIITVEVWGVPENDTFVFPHLYSEPVKRQIKQVETKMLIWILRKIIPENMANVYASIHNIESPN